MLRPQMPASVAWNVIWLATAAALPSLALDQAHGETGPGASYTISTVAGDGESGFAGDGGPAVKAKLARPCAVAVDQQGNLYVADSGNHRIRKIAADGTITTFAGTGEPGFGGDGGPAARAQLKAPYGVSVDRHGQVFVSDQQNHRVRKITQAGIISTVAGDGRRGFDGDGGPAAKAALDHPDATVSDDAGNLYIADAVNHRIRKVDPDGTITTFAGTERGYSGDGGPAARAKLNVPASLALDPQGNLYIDDLVNHAVRKVTPTGLITTVAGTGDRGSNGDDIPATRAQLNEPGGVAVSPDGSLMIADGGNFRIRRVDPEGKITTVAGTGHQGHAGDGGPAFQAELSVLDIMAVDDRGNVFVADYGNHRIRKLTVRP
ncbi:NHL repeat-containing protein [Singulisphaera sp. PoT]|uniref:NHL repeat-containing protein n=1 Tax=Singulisphaera sp. PoT TaxID=3411797 RepID=UPI003BF51B6A